MIGLNCWPSSPRFVSEGRLREIVESLAGTVETVGVFVNESADTVNRLIRDSGLNRAQLHGDESLEYVQTLEVPWFKAFRVSSDFEMEFIRNYGQTRFLLDAYSRTKYGGTGRTIDWKLARKAALQGELILAGGLNPDNVADAIRMVHPYGVDVCSGVESKPGVKDLERVELFIRSVRAAGLTKPLPVSSRIVQ